MRYLFFLFLFLLLGHAAMAETVDRGVTVVAKSRDNRKRIALVIGNSSYRSSPLKNPANDARAMALTLRRLGVEVEEKTDLNYLELNKTVENFGKKLRSGGVGLFYYAGHGMQVNGANYLIPVDAEIDDENEVRFKAVDAGLVLAKMEQARSDVNIVVLDACRDNPFSRSFRSTSHGLASMDAPNGTFIAYATAPGKTAADGDGQNGLYTAELIKVLETSSLPLEQVFKRTLKAVREKSGSRQTPWVASNLEGDFFFIEPSTLTDLQPSPVQPTPISPTAMPAALPTAIPAVVPAVALVPPPPPDPPNTPSLADAITGMEFVPVTGGCFQMGDGFGDGRAYEKPVHQACVSDFSIGKFAVTQGQWKKVMGHNPSHFSSCGDNCPVEKVSWYDVQDFIQRLNALTGKQYRLPTEAEWEFACRSGGKSEKYCGGNDIEAVAWYSGNALGKTHPVGKKQPNGLGIYDMSGNVWQWVQDSYGHYSNGSVQDPQGPIGGTSRVFRGGAWHALAWNVRATFRDNDDPSYRLDRLGFRLAGPPAAPSVR